MTTLVNKLSPAAQRQFEAIALAASLAFLVMILPASIEHVELEHVVITPTLEVSMTWRTLAMPIGIGLMIVLALLRMLDQPRREMLQALALVAGGLRAAVAGEADADRARQDQPHHLLPGGRAADGVRRHSDRLRLRHGDLRLPRARDAHLDLGAGGAARRRHVALHPAVDPAVRVPRPADRDDRHGGRDGALPRQSARPHPRRPALRAGRRDVSGLGHLRLEGRRHGGDRAGAVSRDGEARRRPRRPRRRCWPRPARRPRRSRRA